MEQEGELNTRMHVSGKPYSAVWQQRSPRHGEVRRNLSQRIKESRRCGGAQASRERAGGDGGREEVTDFPFRSDSCGESPGARESFKETLHNTSLRISNFKM